MHFSPTFYRGAAVCSVISAITTLGIIFLPQLFLPVEDFEGRMNRINEPTYVLRSWVYLVHPFLTGMAGVAVAMRLRTVASANALVGVLGFMLWASTEAGQQALTIFAFDVWRAAWPAADEITRAQIRINAAMYDGLWNAMYFLIIVAFTIANFSCGLAMAKHRGLTRIVGGFFLAAAILTVTIIFREIGWPSVPEQVGEWAYPLIQPLGRTLIGVWLWRAAQESGALP